MTSLEFYRALWQYLGALIAAGAEDKETLRLYRETERRLVREQPRAARRRP